MDNMLVEINQSREDFAAYPVGHNMSYADRWTGIPEGPERSYCSFDLDGSRGHFVENSSTNAYSDLKYYFDDPSPTPGAGVNVSACITPVAVAASYNLVSLQESGGTDLAIIVFDAVSGFILGVDDMTPVPLLAFVTSTTYNITFALVSDNVFDIDINGTLFDNSGGHFDTVGSTSFDNVTSFAITTSPAEVSAQFNVYVDNIQENWYNVYSLCVTGESEVAAIASSGSGTDVDPYIIENLDINGTWLYCGMQIRGVSSHVIIRNSIIRSTRDTYTLDAGIRIAYCNNIVIQNVTFINNTRDITAHECFLVTLIDVNMTAPAPLGGSTSAPFYLHGGYSTSLWGAGLLLNVTDTVVSGTLTIFGESVANNVTAVVVALGTGATVLNSRANLITANGNGTIMNCVVSDGGAYGISLGSDHNIVTGNVVDNYTTNGIQAGHSHHNTITNNMISNITGTSANPLSKEGRAIYLRWSGYNTIVNNTMINNAHGIFIGYSVVTPPPSPSANNIVVNNTITCANMTYNQNASNDPILGVVGAIGIDMDEMVDNTTITGNSFAGVNLAIRVGDQPCDLVNNTSITGNNFTSVSDMLVYVADNSENTLITGNYVHGRPTVEFLEDTSCTRNYYRDYFVQFPFALTVNTSTDILEYEWVLSTIINDTEPVYYAPWYPRAEAVNVRFYSLVNYEGIIIDHLRVYIDGVQIASNTFAPGHVIFDLVVYDFEGRLLHDQSYNVNATGLHLNVGLATTAQVFFKFWSSLDGFGLDFGLCNLFVDGIRLTTDSPVMRPRVINVTVTDVYNFVIYDQTINLSVTGVYVDLLLPIAPVSVVNQYNRSVIVYLTRGIRTTTFTMGPQTTLWALRYAVGIYNLTVTELDGTELVHRDHEIDASAPASWAIQFGWYNATVYPDPVPPNVSDTVVISIVVLVIGVYGGFGAFVYLGYRLKNVPLARTTARAMTSRASPRPNNERKPKAQPRVAK